jgi:hypothetical protein
MAYEDIPAPEITARQKFTCPACGAEATWNPAKQQLICEFCGTVSEAKLTGDLPGADGITEHDLLATLNGLENLDRGWAAEKVSVKCQSCQAISVMDPEKVGQRCEFCGSAQLIPFEEQRAPIRPESLLPFKLDQSRVRDSVRAWYGSHFWAPGKLKRMALTDTLHGIYIPYWTFDAQAEADWTADAGYYYYETEYYTDSNGKRASRQVRKVRWEPAAGHVSNFFDDALVLASKGVPKELVRGIEPFPTTSDLVPYAAGYLSGWTVEHYQLDLLNAAREARLRMDREMQQLCSRDVPGDTQRNLQVQTDYQGQTYKHVLLPIWLVTYNYGSRTFRVVVNGYTGRINGTYPISALKIAIAVVLILICVLIFLYMQNSGS